MNCIKQEIFCLSLPWCLCSAIVCHFQPLQESFWGHSKATALAGLGSWEIPSELKLQKHLPWSLWNGFWHTWPTLCLLSARKPCVTLLAILLFFPSGLQEQLITDVKRLTRVLFLYIPLPMFWALLDQQVRSYPWFYPLPSHRKGISHSSIFCTRVPDGLCKPLRWIGTWWVEEAFHPHCGNNRLFVFLPEI